MEYIIGTVAIVGIAYVLHKMFNKKETVQEAVSEVKQEATKVEEAAVAKIIDVPKESAELLDKVQDAITAEGKEAAAELAKRVEEVPALIVQHRAHAAEPIVEEVKKKTRTVKAKAKAIEAVVEAKVEKLEEAVVKKTRTRAKKNG